jgi:murein DD-endopeptidase MepM/ murein hydrolase activator NlpD
VAHPGDVDGSQEAARPDTNEGTLSETPPGQASETARVEEPTGPAATPEPEPRGRMASIPVLDIVLDPRAARDPSMGKPSRLAALSPQRTAAYGLVAGLAIIAATFAALIGRNAVRSRALVQSFSQALPSTSPASSSKPATSAATSSTPVPSAISPAMPPPHPIPGPWRVSQLASSPDMKIVEGTLDRRPLVTALNESGVPRAQVYRLLSAFSDVHKFDKSKPHDGFVVALEVPTRRVRAFEYLISPTEVYQAREKEGGSLSGERLDLHVERKRAAGAIAVADDLPTSLQSAGFEPSLVDLLDDALEGRAQLSNVHSGARIRIVADYETALGVFARYLDVLAIEYLSADSDAAPLRVYYFRGRETQGYFDAKGHQPYKGGFRSPIPFARISSRFNMRRMHPILHVVMPHNGVDFVGSTGTPVYAASNGNIEWIGDGGPSGNLVTIRHASGVTTGYAHLSRFAPHLAQGQPVETRQLVGYVGSTGRSTGPHLHFSVKKNGVFIDPLSLKLDGDKVLPKPERPEFEEQRAAFDKLLDAIPLPPAPEAAPHAKPDAAEGEDLEPLEDGNH